VWQLGNNETSRQFYNKLAEILQPDSSSAPPSVEHSQNQKDEEE